MLIDWSQQDKQLWPGARDSLTAFVKMDIGSGYAAAMRRLCGGFAVRFQEAAFIGVDVGVYETWLKDG